MRIPNHKVSFEFGRNGRFVTTEDIQGYQISTDMLSLADRFTLETRITTELWDLCARDTAVEVYIDDSKVLSGRVDSRRKSQNGITITGRDRGGRLVDTAAPLLKFKGTRIADFADKLAGELFNEIRLENSKNRRLVAGRRAKATAATEPVQAGKNVRHEVTPGETRGRALTSILEQAGILVWSSADGESLILGQPNQAQGAAFHFFQPKAGSAREKEANCSIEYTEDCGEQYSRITVCGDGRGTRNAYSRKVTQIRASVDHPDPDLFDLKKELLVVDHDVRNEAECLERARREMAERNAGAIEVVITAEGHGQIQSDSGATAIYHFDSVALVEDEQIGLRDYFFITAADYMGSPEDDFTILRGVPVGTELRTNG